MKDSATLSRPAETTYAPLVWCVMALLVPRATLFGELAPFGIGLAACGGGVPTLLCLALGYLLMHPLSPVRYLLTIGMVGAIRWILAALPDGGRRRWVPPLVAFACCGGTGLWMLAQSGADLYRVLLIVAESCVAAGAALFLDPAMAALSRPDHPADRTALVLTGAVVVMAAATVEIGGISPGRVAAAFFVLLMARSGREVGGSLAGCVLGGAMALSAPGQMPLAVALAVGGLTAGLFARLGRWCQGGLFLLTAGVIALGDTDPAIVYYLTEISCGCLLFALLPRGWERRLTRLFLPPRDIPAVEGLRRRTALRLRVAGAALSEVAGSVETVSRRLRRWDGGDDAALRLRELQTAVEGQFTGTGDVLESLAMQLERPASVDVELSERVAALCDDYGMAVLDALCVRDDTDGMTVDILTDGGAAPQGGRWLRQMEQLCGRRLSPPTVTRWGERVQITLTEPPRYTVESGFAQLCCDGQRLCGDAVQIQTVDGGVLAVLSDGMGSGGRAAVDSAMTAGITSRLWQAGFTPTAVVKTVNSALLVKSRDERLATLDVAYINTHTGRLDSYKAGAAATLLCSGGRLSRLDRPGLPIGILSAVDFEHSHDTLSHGDVLVMVSDGALAAGVAALEEWVRAYPADGSMQGLAQTICDAARGAEQGRSDDITAVALRITRRHGISANPDI